MLGAALEFGERMLTVAQVHHKHVELNVNMKMLLWKTEESGNTIHVADDAVGVCRTYNKHLTCLQKQIKLATQQFLAFDFLNLILSLTL